VIRMAALVPLPEAPQWISGLLNLHGNVIPVIDLRKKLELPLKETHPDHRIVVIQSDNRKLGVIAEMVEDVILIPEEHIKQPQGTLRKSRLLQSLIQKDDIVYLVLEANAIDSDALIEFEEEAPESAVVSE
jgi:purine-binding chemotaxis protein CheW